MNPGPAWLSRLGTPLESCDKGWSLVRAVSGSMALSISKQTAIIARLWTSFITWRSSDVRLGDHLGDGTIVMMGYIQMEGKHEVMKGAWRLRECKKRDKASRHDAATLRFFKVHDVNMFQIVQLEYQCTDYEACIHAQLQGKKQKHD